MPIAGWVLEEQDSGLWDILRDGRAVQYDLGYDEAQDELRHLRVTTYTTIEADGYRTKRNLSRAR